MTRLPDGWVLSANAFNWTWEVIDARRSVRDIVIDIPRSGVAGTVEVELGQLGGFPEPDHGELRDLRSALQEVGGRVSIVGVSIDEWRSRDRRRDESERWAFLLPQLRAAHVLGAAGVRLPLGQCRAPMLHRLVPVLRDLDLVLYEEFQGSQVPGTASADAAFATIADLNDDRVRLLADISCLMPALPLSYLSALQAGGLGDAELESLHESWSLPETQAAIVDLLRSGRVPSRIAPLALNMIIRFGRSEARDLREILPLVGAVHLKFWDLDDSDGRISGPVRELGTELARVGFSGTLCSEWGGQEWLPNETAADMTRRHLVVAGDWLAEGAAR